MLQRVDGKSVPSLQTNILMNICRPAGWAFFVGLLQAAYTLTGYGMVAAMAEEVSKPQGQVLRLVAKELRVAT